jgi:hypothetical protein
MRRVDNTKSVIENRKTLDMLINSHLAPLLIDQRKNQKKILEICHIGKFLMLWNKGHEISKVTEQPDFVITDGENLIGLEHQIIVDREEKEREGFFKNVFSLAEAELKKDKDLPNFLANCYIMPYANFKISEKQKYINIVVHTVKKYIETHILDENPIIERIFSTPHSSINISENLGAWWQKNLTNVHIIKAIEKKEKLISKYKENCGDEQWLLLVIGSNGGSSYMMNSNEEYHIKTEFNKVFVLEDFSNKLYQIK